MRNSSRACYVEILYFKVGGPIISVRLLSSDRLFYTSGCLQPLSRSFYFDPLPMKNFLDLPISTKVNCVLLHAIFLMLRLMITKLLGLSNAEGITVVGFLVYGGAICK